jgi:hypothetical protein
MVIDTRIAMNASKFILFLGLAAVTATAFATFEDAIDSTEPGSMGNWSDCWYADAAWVFENQTARRLAGVLGLSQDRD